MGGKTGNDVVWHEGDLTEALNDILARRIIRVEKAGVEGWPDWSPRYAKLEDITVFIEGRTDDTLIADLLWGLSLIDWQTVEKELRGRASHPNSCPPLSTRCSSYAFALRVRARQFHSFLPFIIALAPAMD